MASIVKVDQIQNSDGTVEYLNTGLKRYSIIKKSIDMRNIKKLL